MPALRLLLPLLLVAPFTVASSQIEEPDPSQPASVVVAHVRATSPTNIWITGWETNELWRWNGTALRYLPLPDSLLHESRVESLTSVATISPTLTYVGGRYGSLWKHDGRRYERLSLLPPQIKGRIHLAARSATELYIVSDSAEGVPAYLWVPDSTSPGHFIPHAIPFPFEVRELSVINNTVVVHGTANSTLYSIGDGVILLFRGGRWVSNGWSPTRRDSSDFTTRSLGSLSTNGRRTLVHFLNSSSMSRSSTALVADSGRWRPIQTAGGIMQYMYAVAPNGEIMMMSNQGLMKIDTLILYKEDPILSPPPRYRTRALLPFSPTNTLVVEGELLVRYTPTTRTVLARFRVPDGD